MLIIVGARGRRRGHRRSEQAVARGRAPHAAVRRRRRRRIVADVVDPALERRARRHRGPRADGAAARRPLRNKFGEKSRETRSEISALPHHARVSLRDPSSRAGAFEDTSARTRRPEKGQAERAPRARRSSAAPSPIPPPPSSPAPAGRATPARAARVAGRRPWAAAADFSASPAFAPPVERTRLRGERIPLPEGRDTFRGLRERTIIRLVWRAPRALTPTAAPAPRSSPTPAGRPPRFRPPWRAPPARSAPNTCRRSRRGRAWRRRTAT